MKAQPIILSVGKTTDFLHSLLRASEGWEFDRRIADILQTLESSYEIEDDLAVKIRTR